MKYISLSNTEAMAIVDDADYDEISKYRWYAIFAKNTMYAARSYYCKGLKKTKLATMHRQIVGEDNAENKDVHHVNKNGIDNRRSNLAVVTHSQNLACAYRKKNNSGFRGIRLRSDSSKWTAQIRVNKVLIHIGYFKDSRDAAMAYDKAAEKYFGEYAYLNIAGKKR